MYLAAIALICQVQCNVLPRGTSGSVILFLGNAAAVYMAGYPSAGSCKTALGHALDADCCFMMSGCPFLHPTLAYT